MIDIADFQQRMVEARTYTKSLFADDALANFRRQAHAEFSPIGWHLGHIAVTEGFWILQQCKQDASLAPGYDTFFSPLDNPKDNRINLPATDEIFAYLDDVRERVFTFLERKDWPDTHPLLGEGCILNMLLQHEEQHTETILLILNLIAAERFDAGESLAGGGQEVAQLNPYAPTPSSQMIRIPAGSFTLGSSDRTTTLDNERQARSVQLEEFLIDSAPVTNGDFLNFMTRGGYQNPAWWSHGGWQWCQENHLRHPLHWRPTDENGQWQEIGPCGARPLDSHQPVMCVSWYEADAYARSIDKRLPTEAEWERTACWDSDMSDASPHCLGMLGGVWEWTDTWFHPYPGFQAFPYDGYSVPYFDQKHRVLRGGSWATRRHVLRPTFRNWYHPGMRAVFAGFRCAKDAAS